MDRRPFHAVIHSVPLMSHADPDAPPPTPGTLLVAVPPLSDPNFRRTVILLCDHSVDGSFGLVLNRPTGLPLSEAVAEPLPFDAELWIGGPVQPDTLHFVHPYGDDVEGALPVLHGIFWGGAFESICEGARSDRLDASRIRFFVGYSGWGPGQLDEEVDEGAWIVLESDPETVFAASDDALWRSVLRQMGGEYALLSTFPDDPRMN